jgi:hypothetical protein
MRPLAHAVPDALAELLRDRPLSAGKVAFAWRMAVGPAMDRATAVKLEEGVLVVEAVSRQWVREVARASPVVLSRLQKLLGSDAVTRIQVRPDPG